MSLFTRFPASRFLLFGSLAIVTLSSPLRAQDLRKWMPNVGDRFVIETYIQTTDYSHGHPVNGGTTGQIQTYVILAVDSTLFGIPHTVLTTVNGDTTTFVFKLSSDSTSPMPVIIGNYDFSTGTPIYDSLHDLATVSISGATYSLKYHWFTSWGNWSTEPDGPSDEWTGEAQTQTSYLDSAFLESVTLFPSFQNVLIIQAGSTGEILSLDVSSDQFHQATFQLLNTLGCELRSWQIPIDAGERQITLNVADVPSGVYFLHVSAAGVDEMRKVVIMH